MGKEIRYLVVKKKNQKEITYFEYDKLSGLDITPKNKKPIADCINVNKMILIQPTLIDKLVSKKLDRRFKRLFNFIAMLLETDDDSGTALMEALNEIEKFRLEVKNKYREYMSKEELHLLAKKLIILQDEVKQRMYIIESKVNNEKTGKSR